MRNPVAALVGRVRSWFALEWVGEDDLYVHAFSEITPALYVGRRPTTDSIVQLERSNITHVVSCLQESARDDLAFIPSTFDHLFLAADDEMDQDLSIAVDAFFAYVDEVRAHHAEPRLLVHCEVGVSRSASLAIALIMRDDGRSFIDAYELVRSKRVQVLPNLAFASQLQQLEMQQHEMQLQPDVQGSGPSSLAQYLRRYCNAPTDIEELDDALARHNYDAPSALRSIYGGEIPRVIQGARSARR